MNKNTYLRLALTILTGLLSTALIAQDKIDPGHPAKYSSPTLKSAQNQKPFALPKFAKKTNSAESAYRKRVNSEEEMSGKLGYGFQEKAK